MDYNDPPPISAQFLNDFRVTSSWQGMVQWHQRTINEMLFPSVHENGIRKTMMLVETEHPVNHLRNYLPEFIFTLTCAMDRLFQMSNRESDYN